MPGLCIPFFTCFWHFFSDLQRVRCFFHFGKLNKKRAVAFDTAPWYLELFGQNVAEHYQICCDPLLRCQRFKCSVLIEHFKRHDGCWLIYKSSAAPRHNQILHLRWILLCNLHCIFKREIHKTLYQFVVTLWDPIVKIGIISLINDDLNLIVFIYEFSFFQTADLFCVCGYSWLLVRECQFVCQNTA